MLDATVHMSFLKPAMTYDDYSDTSILKGLKCFQKISAYDDQISEFLHAYNESSTKAVVIK